MAQRRHSGWYPSVPTRRMCSAKKAISKSAMTKRGFGSHFFACETFGVISSFGSTPPVTKCALAATVPYVGANAASFLPALEHAGSSPVCYNLEADHVTSKCEGGDIQQVQRMCAKRFIAAVLHLPVMESLAGRRGHACASAHYAHDSSSLPTRV